MLQQLININLIKTGDFTLKSGLKSNIYIDFRNLISYPKLLSEISDLVWEKLLLDLKPSLLCGVPYTALPITTAISLKHKIPMILVRKESKNYGTGKQIEGNFNIHQSCVIIEDVITTGSSILSVTNLLRESGLIINTVVGLVDREQGGRENLLKNNLTLHTLWKLSELSELTKNL